MKIRKILCLSVALILPQLAVAKLPLSNDSLGKMESILDFCAQFDAQGASKYQERKKLIVGESSEKEVAEARKTREYTDGYQEMSDQLANVPKPKTVQACSAGPARSDTRASVPAERKGVAAKIRKASTVRP